MLSYPLADLAELSPQTFLLRPACQPLLQTSSGVPLLILLQPRW